MTFKKHRIKESAEDGKGIAERKEVTANIREALKKMIREEYDKAIREAGPDDFHQQDILFRGFSFDDLITAVQSNEHTINSQTVTRVFNELYRANLEEALYNLKSRMKSIIKNAQ